MFFLLIFLSLKPDIYIITIDTLRKDFLSIYNEKSAKTPNIDKFAKENIVFKDATTPVPLTLPAHFSIFTGLYPYNHNVRDNGEVYNSRHPLLAEILSSNGYDCFSFISSDIFNPNSGIFKGFKKVFSNLNNITGESTSYETFKLIRNFLSNQKKDKPLFLWIHFYDPHFPYMPENFLDINSIKAYKKEVENVDEVFGKLYEMIKLLSGDEAIIFVLSDHGESLGENFEKTHGYFLFESTIKIPFLMKMPKMDNKYIEGQVSLIDIFPTILSYLKIKYSGVDGINLLPFIYEEKKVKARSIYIETLHLYKTFNLFPIIGIREEGKKFIYGLEPKFYILKSEEKEKKLDRKALKEYLNKLKKFKDFEKEEKIETFKSLGYINPFEGKKIQVKNEKGLIEIVQKSEDIICNTLTGREFLKRNEISLAIEYLDKSLEKEPFFYDGLIYKTIAYLLKNKPFDAIKNLDKVRKKDGFVYYLYGWAYLQLGEGEKAENNFKECLKSNPENLQFKIGLAKSMLLQNKYKEGENLLLEVLKKDNENMEAKEALKELYEKLKGYNEKEKR